MHLLLIKDTVCPDCASETVAESCRHRHCCGEGFEVREFACGCSLRWSPNFSRLEVVHACPKSAESQRQVGLRQDLLKCIQDVVSSHPVDKAFKDKVTSSLQWLS